MMEMVLVLESVRIKKRVWSVFYWFCAPKNRKYKLSIELSLLDKLLRASDLKVWTDFDQGAK